MIAAVADTHAVIWYLAAATSLSVNARAYIEDLAANGNQIGVSTITLIEVVYLVEKGRLSQQALQQLLDVLVGDDSLFREVVVDRAVASALARVPREQVADLPDRVIAATAVLLGVPLISRDRRIIASGVDTVW